MNQKALQSLNLNFSRIDVNPKDTIVSRKECIQIKNVSLCFLFKEQSTKIYHVKYVSNEKLVCKTHLQSVLGPFSQNKKAETSDEANDDFFIQINLLLSSLRSAHLLRKDRIYIIASIQCPLRVWNLLHFKALTLYHQQMFLYTWLL